MKCADTKLRVTSADYGRICCSGSAACSPSRRDAKRKCDVAFASDAALMTTTTNGLPVMVVGGPTAISAAPLVSSRAASCASPCCCCCCCCCPDLQVWSPATTTPLSGGGMWSAQLRSSPPPHAAASQTGTAHGCAALADKQALFLVAFPICASSANSQASNHLHPASTTPTSTASCRCCCKCSWSVKSAPCWNSPQDSEKTSFLLNEEESKPASGPLEERLMEAPPPSPPTSQHRHGNQLPPHLSPSPGAPVGAGPPSDVDTDLSRVRDALRTLATSGYYYEGLSWEEAGRLLRGQPVGTFLVRDSSDNRFLFALSVQTERGPTSVRIHYWRGQFRLDCEDALAGSMPWFSCVVSLVEHYVRLSRSAKGQMCVWLDGHGRRDLPIVLTRPLYREPASLQHLCRIALNRSAATVAAATSTSSSMCRTVEPLPAALKDYLRDYPHLH
ncbi:hypothetical protein HPB52_025330 [Rhipicephalus sanguineus]|uniref:Suppressor of cytokine signaling 2 n=2 Tax=Rhipicephalus sanguineus TaxID=34632 RepID=A0A9D4TD54_RHISA|nr:hypothetical protein HPB52_025330 [Rhipicephalus sanguineus]